jgi:hypothetical protein
MDLSNLVTPRGTKIILHFEGGSEPAWLGEQYTPVKLGKKLSLLEHLPKFGKWDAGKGTEVHMLMNLGGKIVKIFLTESEFAEWQKDPKWEFPHPRLDLSNLVTPKGTKVVVHFEDEDDLDDLAEENTREKFLAETSRAIASENHGRLDTGNGTTVHLLINNEGDGLYLSEAEYAEWQKVSDWPHRPHHSDDTLSKLLLFGLLTGIGHPSGDYNGATREEFVKYMENPAANAVGISAAKSQNCKMCPVPLCPKRHDSFNKVDFDAAVAAYKP